MSTTAETFELAVQYHQGGDLQQAEWLYRQVLAADPSHVWALNNLGVALKSLGQLADAIRCHAQRLNPFSRQAPADKAALQ